jgi:outer membrane lipoprotein-sorting protein
MRSGVGRIRGGLLVGAVLLLPSPGLALETAEEIRACVRNNLPHATSIQEILVRTFDRIGGERSFDAKVYWKRGEDDQSKLLMRVSAPPDLRGTAYLALQRQEVVDMFTYLPEVKRVRRIHSRSISGSFLGTDFTYEDIARLPDVATGSRLERQPDAEIGGRAVYVLDAWPTEESESAYDRIIASVDKETCVLLKALFYEEGPEPRKILVAEPSSLTRKGKTWLARKMTMKDLGGGGESELTVKKIQIDVEIPDNQFSQARLGRKH